MLSESLEPRRLLSARLAVDLSFGVGDGTATRSGTTFLGQAGGRIYTAGTASDPNDDGDSYPAFFRDHADGTFDRQLGPVDYVAKSPKAAAVDSAGGLIVADASGGLGQIHVTRYTPANKLDPAYGGTIKVHDPLAQTARPAQVLVAADGAAFVLLTARLLSDPSMVHAWVAKVDASGRGVDYGFGGKLDLGNVARDAVPQLVGVDSAGRLYLLAGGAVVRQRPSGVRDSSFARGGTLRQADPIARAALTSDGLLYTVTTDASGAAIQRFDTSGQADPAFVQGPSKTFSYGSDTHVKALLVDADDAVYVQVNSHLFVLSRGRASFNRIDGAIDTIVAVQSDGQYLVQTDGGIQRLAPASRVAVNADHTAFVRTDSAADQVTVADTRGGVRLFLNGKTITLHGVKRLNVNLGDGDNVYTSTATLPTTLLSGAGDDQITPGNGSNFVFTAAGNDTVLGGLGSDAICPGSGDNVVDVGGDDLTDSVSIGSFINNAYGAPLDGPAGHQTITGGHRLGRLTVDLRYVTSADVTYTGRIADVSVAGTGPSVIELNTSSGAIVVGGSGDDTIRTGRGGDQLSGAGGNDLIEAGSGDDTLFGYAGHDTLRGGPGTDTADTDASDTLDSIEKQTTPQNPY